MFGWLHFMRIMGGRCRRTLGPHGPYRPYRSHRPYGGSVWAGALALCLAAGLFTGSARAVAEDIFSASRVPVDVTADSDLEAKQRGLAEAKATAINILFARIVRREDFQRLPDIDAQQLETLLRDIAIESEKFGGGRYVADITVRFKAPEVRALLSENGIAFAETRSRPLVLLPVYLSPRGLLLWAQDNPWLTAWREVQMRPGLAPIIVPRGDETDAALIDVSAAFSGAPERMEGMARRYGATAVLSALARRGVDTPEGGVSLDVTLLFHGGGWDAKPIRRRYDGAPGQPETEVMAEAVRATRIELDEMWKRRNLIATHVRPGRLAVVAPLRGNLAGWVALQAALARVAVIKNIRLRRLSVDRAWMEFSVVGSMAQIQVAMEQENLSLDFDTALGTWQLSGAVLQP